MTEDDTATLLARIADLEKALAECVDILEGSYVQGPLGQGGGQWNRVRLLLADVDKLLARRGGA